MNKNIYILLSLSILVFAGCSTSSPETIDEVSDQETAEIIETVENQALSIQEILDAAYLDELKAEATYEQVIAQFGAEKPFTNIINAEVKHSQSILGLYDKFGLTAPEFEGVDVPTFASIQEACSAGVTAEIANIAIYEDLMPQINEDSIVQVFDSLQRASAENHLPAFERCSN